MYWLCLSSNGLIASPHSSSGARKRCKWGQHGCNLRKFGYCVSDIPSPDQFSSDIALHKVAPKASALWPPGVCLLFQETTGSIKPKKASSFSLTPTTSRLPNDFLMRLWPFSCLYNWSLNMIHLDSVSLTYPSSRKLELKTHQTGLCQRSHNKHLFFQKFIIQLRQSKYFNIFWYAG